MKLYEIELVRTSYLDCKVEAVDEEDAKEKAFDELQISTYDREFWGISFCDELNETAEKCEEF